MDGERDAYEVLEIDSAATTAEIRLAFRRGARRTHPDRDNGSDEDFIELRRAYDQVLDRTKRAQYDASRRSRPTASADPGPSAATPRPPSARPQPAGPRPSESSDTEPVPPPPEANPQPFAPHAGGHPPQRPRTPHLYLLDHLHPVTGLPYGLYAEARFRARLSPGAWVYVGGGSKDYFSVAYVVINDHDTVHVRTPVRPLADAPALMVADPSGPASIPLVMGALIEPNRSGGQPPLGVVLAEGLDPAVSVAGQRLVVDIGGPWVAATLQQTAKGTDGSTFWIVELGTWSLSGPGGT